MPDINLLQNQLKDTTLASSKRNKIYLWVVSLLLLLLGSAAGWLFYSTSNLTDQVGVITTENQQIQQKLNSNQNNLGEAKSFQAKLGNIKMLLASHVYLTPLLDELGKMT